MSIMNWMRKLFISDEIMAWLKKKIWRAGPGENFYRDLNRVDPSSIVDKFFKKDDPVWIRNGQLNDLKELDQSDLMVLYSIDTLPLTIDKKNYIECRLNKPNMLQRLLRRYAIAQAIAEAKREGLYDTAEHLTSKINL